MKSLFFYKTPLSISTSGNAARLLGPVSIVWLLAAVFGAHAPAMAVPPAPCSGTCYVAVNGDDNNSGDLDFPKKTIQAAIDQVDEDGVVFVADGLYEEQVTVTKPLSLLGPNAHISGMGIRGDEAIVQFPAGAANGSSLIFVNSNVHGVTISGFDLRAQDETIGNYHQLIRAGGFSAGEPRNDLTIPITGCIAAKSPSGSLPASASKAAPACSSRATISMAVPT